MLSTLCRAGVDSCKLKTFCNYARICIHIDRSQLRSRSPSLIAATITFATHSYRMHAAHQRSKSIGLSPSTLATSVVLSNVVALAWPWIVLANLPTISLARYEGKDRFRERWAYDRVVIP